MAAADYYAQVQQAYIAYYGRPADPAGLIYWANQLNQAGGNLNSIINAFGNSAESTALYSSGNLYAEVNQIYQTLFGRAADVTGANFYVQGIQTGQFTLASVALNIYNGAQGTDATELAAKLGYAQAFTNALAQNVSEAAAYSGNTAANNARAALQGVIDTTSEQTAINNLPTTLASIGGTPVGQTVTLTTGVDNVTLTGNNNVVNGIIGNASGGTATAVSTFTPLDSITAAKGSTGNVFNLAVTTAAGAAASDLPAGVTVSGVQTVNLADAGATGVDNFSSWTGLTQLNVTEVGGAQGITAAGTTNVSLTDAAAAAAAINVQGGANVAVTANGVTTAGVTGVINVGTTAAVTGTVTVTENMLATQTGAATADAINVKGGTTVTVTANLTEAAGAGNTVTGGAIGVTGTSATTTVTVNQTADAAASAAVAATAGSAGATLVTAAPGVTGVAAAAATAATAAKAAVAGVVDGAVTVTDANYGTTNANTITSVSLSNYGGGAAGTYAVGATTSVINDNALANLSLSGTAGTLAIDNNTTSTTSGAVGTPGTNSSLNLTLNGLSAPTVAAGVVTSATGGNNTITDINNEIKTLNVITAGADSTLTAFADTGLTTLNVSGTNVLKLGAINGSLTALNVSGAAGFNDGGVAAGSGLAARGAALAITDTSSGKFTAVLDATTQSFTGSTGQDVITIDDRATATAFKAIAAGSATNNELILDGGAFGLTAAQAAKLTGFQTVGVTSSVTGTIDMSVLNPNASSLDIVGSTGITFNKVAKGASVSIDANTTGTVAVNYADATGASDSTTLTIGAATNKAAITAFGLSLADANGVGVGTVNIVSNDVAYDPATNTGNTITTLTDNGLSTLNVSGTGALTITNLTESTTQATSFTLNNTDSGVGGLSIGTFTDANLGNLTFTGSGNTSISTLVDNASVLNVANSGTGVVSIGTLTDSLTSLTLNGNVALGQVGTTAAEKSMGLQDAFANGVTISGASDNAHVTVNLTTGAAATFTDSITLGNGNNYVIDASTAGKVNVTVGTGSNLIDLSAGGTAATYSANVTLGAHSAATGSDSILTGVVTAGAVAPNTVINGAVAGDIITLKDAAFASVGQVTAAQQTSISAAANLAAAVAAADNGLASHAAVAFQYGGNTYVVENSGAGAGTGTLAAGDTLIQLTGAHTVGSTITAGHFALTA
ncbi:hypothetical protein [Paraburkholderia tagetis]|uniref:DUF4214 domain-containing protein n=1 Tax=Paraburkholderia tagetis TaxID=2913261 RepID=A0A9X1RLM9_9BURK|nr:hypothetical protein [Paraburkholderia tagetis]MCG5074521.1 hypothetical protein [Paraburkholderia tagetis]